MNIAKNKKINVNLYTRYKMFSWDVLFYYAIIFLFFTKTKGINAADVLLAESFYPIFKILFLIPATIIINSLGKRKALITGNSLICLAIFVYIIAFDFKFIVIGELLSAIGFIIKGVCESNILYDISLSSILQSYKLGNKRTKAAGLRPFVINCLFVFLWKYAKDRGNIRKKNTCGSC